MKTDPEVRTSHLYVDEIAAPGRPNFFVIRRIDNGQVFVTFTKPLLFMSFDPSKPESFLGGFVCGTLQTAVAAISPLNKMVIAEKKTEQIRQRFNSLYRYSVDDQGRQFGDLTGKYVLASELDALRDEILEKLNG